MKFLIFEDILRYVTLINLPFLAMQNMNTLCLGVIEHFRIETFFQMFPPMQSRVMEWLKRQSESEPKDTSGLTLLNKMKINHIEQGRGTSSLHTKFVVSEESESIGIASPQAKPTLSVMYPGTDKPPAISPREDGYTSALFLTISDKEYLVAASVDQIHLWNPAKNTSSVVYQLKEQKDWHLCAIDERSVACVAEQPGLDGYSKIYTLNTGPEKFNLSSTLRVESGPGNYRHLLRENNGWHSMSTSELPLEFPGSISRNVWRKSSVAG